MSPEQAAGRSDEIDGRTDLFALAATGFRLISGRRIHESESLVELVIMMSRLAAPRLRTVAPQVSEPFARVIDRALEFRREDRYASAAEMRADVQKALAELDGPVPGAPTPAAPPLPPKAIELSSSDLQPAESVPAASERQTKVDAPTPALPEELLAPLPRARRSWVPLLLLLAAAGGGALLAYQAGWLRHAAPTPVASSVPPAASSNAPAKYDASAVAASGDAASSDASIDAAADAALDAMSDATLDGSPDAPGDVSRDADAGLRDASSDARSAPDASKDAGSPKTKPKPKPKPKPPKKPGR
jgi:hypothetical protein